MMEFTYKNKFILFLLVLACDGYALSATTAQSIQGTPPNLKSALNLVPVNKNHILHFSIPDDTKKSTVNYFGDSDITTITFPETLRLADFDITRWEDNLFSDNDGDSPNLTNMVTYKKLTATWTDKYNNNVNVASYLDRCYSPYELTIETTDFTVHSQYGDPRYNNLGELSQKFIINVDDIEKICTLKPDYLGWVAWRENGGGPPSITSGKIGNTIPSESNFGGGYMDEFIPSIGFKPDITGDKFPTTAFSGASFTIITSKATLFTPSSAPSFATLTHNGKFTFVSRPPYLPYTVTLTNNMGTLSYSFTIRTWLEPKIATDDGMSGTNYLDYTQAKTVCNNMGMSLAKRSDLTSSPKNSISGGALGNNNVFIRGIGSVDGEWGSVHRYPKSSWLHGYYWTDDLYQPNNPYVVGINFGSVGIYSVITSLPSFVDPYPTTVCVMR